LLSGCALRGLSGRCCVSERVQVWVPADALELASSEADLAGVSVNAWLEEAAVGHVERQRALRAMEAREREGWGGWHPDDGATGACSLTDTGLTVHAN
jgi:hypothetical protein